MGGNHYKNSEGEQTPEKKNDYKKMELGKIVWDYHLNREQTGLYEAK